MVLAVTRQIVSATHHRDDACRPIYDQGGSIDLPIEKIARVLVLSTGCLRSAALPHVSRRFDLDDRRGNS